MNTYNLTLIFGNTLEAMVTFSCSSELPIDVVGINDTVNQFLTEKTDGGVRDIVNYIALNLRKKFGYNVELIETNGLCVLPRRKETVTQDVTSNIGC